MHDCTGSRDRKHHVSQPEGDREFEEVPLGEDSARSAASSVVDIGHYHALLAEVDEAVLRHVHPARNLGEAVGPVLSHDRQSLSSLKEVRVLLGAVLCLTHGPVGGTTKINVLFE